MINLFYLSVGIIGYTYVGYPLIAMLMSKVKKMVNKEQLIHWVDSSVLPTVTIIIAAYNERESIGAKIQNTLSLDYPSQKRKIIVVTDGSTDGTEKIVAQFPEVQLLHQSERQGKAAAINRALPMVEQGIVVFTDANAMLNTASLQELVKNFQKTEMGAVAGEKKVTDSRNDGAVAVEGLYWKYESIVRQWDAQIHSVPGAAGELFAVRSNLLAPLPVGTICDDLYLSVQVIHKGYRVGYESNAYGSERYSYSIQKEWKRKLRIAAGSIQLLSSFGLIRFFFKRPLPAFQLISRKIIRWILVPYLMLLLIGLSAYLSFNTADDLIQVLISLQWVFYGMAFIGWMTSGFRFLPRLFFFPFYFVLANAAMIIGTIHYLSGKSYAVWEKVR